MTPSRYQNTVHLAQPLAGFLSKVDSGNGSNEGLGRTYTDGQVYERSTYEIHAPSQRYYDGLIQVNDGSLQLYLCTLKKRFW
jgi:hypothetical protein